MAGHPGVVVGAGVVGLAVARSLARSGVFRSAGVIVVDKGPAIGTETSSRNSEVIHAGIYYPKGSLKAQMCVRGKHMLYSYCEEKAIPVCVRVSAIVHTWGLSQVSLLSTPTHARAHTHPHTHSHTASDLHADTRTHDYTHAHTLYARTGTYTHTPHTPHTRTTHPPTQRTRLAQHKTPTHPHACTRTHIAHPCGEADSCDGGSRDAGTGSHPRGRARKRRR